MKTSSLPTAIELLPIEAQKEVYDFAEFLVKKYEIAPKKHPVFGCMKGMLISMSDDFNEPLEDFKEYM